MLLFCFVLFCFVLFSASSGRVESFARFLRVICICNYEKIYNLHVYVYKRAAEISRHRALSVDCRHMST